jgi:shikimate kinase
MEQLQTRIFFIGMMGAGKSYWAKRMAMLFEVPYFDIDAMVEEIAGETIAVIFEKPNGEAMFRNMEKQVLQETQWPDTCFISCGGGLPCYFDNMDYMLASGKVIYLAPTLDMLADRLWNQSATRPLVAACNSRENLLEKLSSLLDQRYLFYNRANVTITGNPGEEVLLAAIEYVQKG